MKIKQIIATILLVCLVLLTKASGDSLKKEITILSWNVYLLPAYTFKFTGQVKRSKKIARLIEEKSVYDVIIFQEVFHKKALLRLKKALSKSYPYQIGPANDKGFIKTNSGVWIVSKFPIEFIKEIKFGKGKGADAWARKGALMVRMDHEEQPMYIIGTHLQAGSGERRDTIRAYQYRKIRDELVEPAENKDIPLLIAGDLNTKKTGPMFDMMKTTLQVEDHSIEGEQQMTSSTPDYGGPQHCIDYIFIDSKKKKLRTEHRIRRFLSNWKSSSEDEKKQDLSDHFAVEMKICW